MVHYFKSWAFQFHLKFVQNRNNWAEGSFSLTWLTTCIVVIDVVDSDPIVMPTCVVSPGWVGVRGVVVVLSVVGAACQRFRGGCRRRCRRSSFSGSVEGASGSSSSRSPSPVTSTVKIIHRFRFASSRLKQHCIHIIKTIRWRNLTCYTALPISRLSFWKPHYGWYPYWRIIESVLY